MTARIITADPTITRRRPLRWQLQTGYSPRSPRRQSLLEALAASGVDPERVASGAFTPFAHDEFCIRGTAYQPRRVFLRGDAMQLRIRRFHWNPMLVLRILWAVIR